MAIAADAPRPSGSLMRRDSVSSEPVPPPRGIEVSCEHRTWVASCRLVGHVDCRSSLAGERSATEMGAPMAERVTKDPKGGLTAAGREKFHREQGSNLKPGVTKPASQMTPEEMKRKGSWAVRFYGRATLPPLVDAHGEPTRFALTAHAWGEAVPKTEAEARRIAEKGRALLAQAKKAAPAARPAVKSSTTAARKTRRSTAAPG